MLSIMCCVAQAIKDMIADGTLARLQEEFNVGSFTPEDLTPEQCRGLESNIASNSIANFVFTKYCPCPLSFVLNGATIE